MKNSLHSLLFVLGVMVLVGGCNAPTVGEQRECVIHKCPMLEDTVYVDYGAMIFPKEYLEARPSPKTS